MDPQSDVGADLYSFFQFVATRLLVFVAFLALLSAAITLLLVL